MKSGLHWTPPDQADGSGHQPSVNSPIASSPRDTRDTPFSPTFGDSPHSGAGHTSAGPPSHTLNSSHPRSPLPPINQIYHNNRMDSPFYPHLPPPSTPLSSTLIRPPLSTFGSYRTERGLSVNPNNPAFAGSPNGRRRTLSTNIYSANNSGDEEDLPSAALAAPISVVNGMGTCSSAVAEDAEDRPHRHSFCSTASF